MKIKMKFQRKDGTYSESEMDLDISKEDFEEYLDLFCKCDYLEKNPEEDVIYVENYEGVHHGFICPSCRKFVQIG